MGLVLSWTMPDGEQVVMDMTHDPNDTRDTDRLMRCFIYGRCAGCKDVPPEDMHAAGWRYQTCSDGEPRLLCPTCQVP